MKTLFYLAMFAVVFAACDKSSSDDGYPVTPEDLNVSVTTENVIKADNEFGFDMFRQVTAQYNPVNQFISPTSIALALAMTYNGANGDTKTAMEVALRKQGFTSDEINASYKSLINALASVDPRVLLEIANSIWYRNDFIVRPQFISVNQENYKAVVSSLDFNAPSSLLKINSWVNDNTHGRIDKIIDEIPSDAVMYLINAIYFKGLWKYEFEKKNTIQGLFKVTGGNTVNVPFMEQTAAVPFLWTDQFRMIELPYGRGNFSMMVMLPNEGFTTADIINSLTSENWESWISMLHTSNVDISLPKFTFEYKNILNQELAAMGMGIAFSGAADFSGITDGGGINISRVIHKTFVEVNEEGTEAAAVTAVEMELTSMPENILFKVDHPFVFAIRETTTGAILFIGRVQNPSIKENDAD